MDKRFLWGFVLGLAATWGYHAFIAKLPTTKGQ
jgi:hypothetical protein